MRRDQNEPWIKGTIVIRIVSTLLVLAVCVPQTFAQKRTRATVTPPAEADSLQPSRRKIITVRYGVGIPLSNKAMTQFWAPGQSVSAEFLINITPRFSLGVGLDAAQYPFREPWFALAYPTVPPQKSDLYWWNLYFASKLTFPGRSRFAPFAIGQIGVSRITAAEYREVIGGVRVTYYDIKGRTRLTVGLGGGVDYFVYRWLFLQAEAKTTYAHNDPQRSFIPLLRAGAVFIL